MKRRVKKMNIELRIGDLVSKYSGRPFKSGNKEEKIIEFTINQHSNKPAARLSDESVVDLHILNKK